MHDLGSAMVGATPCGRPQLTARLPAVTQGSARTRERKEKQVVSTVRRKTQTQTKNTVRPPRAKPCPNRRPDQRGGTARYSQARSHTSRSPSTPEAPGEPTAPWPSFSIRIGLTFAESHGTIAMSRRAYGFERSEYAPQTIRKASRGWCEPSANRARNGSWSRDPKDDLGHRVDIAGVSAVIGSGVSVGWSNPYMSSGRPTPPIWVVPRTCKRTSVPFRDGGFLFVRRSSGRKPWFRALSRQHRRSACEEASPPRWTKSRRGFPVCRNVLDSFRFTAR